MAPSIEASRGSRRRRARDGTPEWTLCANWLVYALEKRFASQGHPHPLVPAARDPPEHRFNYSTRGPVRP